VQNLVSIARAREALVSALLALSLDPADFCQILLHPRLAATVDVGLDTIQLAEQATAVVRGVCAGALFVLDGRHLGLGSTLLRGRQRARGRFLTVDGRDVGR